MTPKSYFDIAAAVRDIFVRTGIFDAEGNWAADMPVTAIARAAEEIEQLLVQYGLKVPQGVDRVLFYAPLLSQLASNVKA